ncbi:MAG: segregation and condensation protein A [Alphaproteobacteria bacterium]
MTRRATPKPAGPGAAGALDGAFDAGHRDGLLPGPVQHALFVDVDGFEGPLDLLLLLAREQKVDLAQISILALADQYIAYIEAAHQLRIEIAADYLVMAAWLAYLKSRLLLPQPRSDAEEPSAGEMAAALAFHLQRLEAMQRAGQRLMARPLLGQDRFPCGAPQPMPVVLTGAYADTLYDLLSAYGALRRRSDHHVLHIAPAELFSMQQALERLTEILGRLPKGVGTWLDLARFLPEELRGGLFGRSAVAATFAAGLELARSGHVELRQDEAFGPIYLRTRDGGRRDE